MASNHLIKKIFAWAAVLALLLAGVQALADQIYVNGSAPVYDRPSESATLLGTLKNGVKVNVAAEKDGWSMLKNGDLAAYVKSADLIRVENIDAVTAYAKVDTPLYSSFSTDSTVLGTVPRDAAVTVSARAGELAGVRYGSARGFVKSSDLTTQTPEQGEQTETAEQTVYVAKDGAKVYDARGRAVGTLPLNTKLTLTGVSGDICRVRRDGATAYMHKSDLSLSEVSTETEQPTETMSQKAYVNKDGAKTYDIHGSVTGSLPLNTAVTVTAVKGRVCRISVGSETSYILKADLSLNQSEPTAPETTVSTTVYAAKDGVKMYSAEGSVIATLALNTAVTVTAVKGEVCKVKYDGRIGYIMRADLSTTKAEEPEATEPTGKSTVTPAKGTAKEMDWWTSDIQTIFARGTTAQITDVDTGLSWKVQRRGGTNHADVQPLTAADTAAMKEACGSWSWTRRAIFVTINGVNYAASMNCMPHGGGSITDNNFNGHHCVHFTNSRTHGGNKVCPLHQAAIKKAASTTL